MAASLVTMHADVNANFEEVLAMARAEVEHALDGLLGAANGPGEIVRPQRLLAAMRHGVFNGGKRLRPFLLIESAALFEADRAAALRVAAALECVHCYSLIHDDLPAMDDDDYRRGQPTVHRHFDEATAILAGDSLLTIAFEIIADEATLLSPHIRAQLVVRLSQAAGIGGMAGGQMLDLQAADEAPDEEGIIRLQAMKTGALIRFACEAGAMAGNASAADRTTLAAYGEAVGLAFQLADDLLDVTGDEGRLGKAAGKDEAAGKATLVAMHGVDWAQKQMTGLAEQANELLAPFGTRADRLRQTTHFIVSRSM